MSHLGNANKTVGETPRTDAAYFKPGATMYDLAGEMKRVERELNAANEKIEVLLISDCERLRIENELAAANERIKRLVEAGDALKAAGYFGGWADAVNNWLKAKEAKP